MVEKQFEYLGYKCEVHLTHMGHRCGYIYVPKDNPLYEKLKDEDFVRREIDCHCGVTWQSVNENTGEKCIGWDYAHYGDGPIEYEELLKIFENAVKENPDNEKIRDELDSVRWIQEDEDRFLDYQDDNLYGHCHNLQEVIRECKNVAEQIQSMIKCQQCNFEDYKDDIERE